MALEQLTHGETETLVLTDDLRGSHQGESAAASPGEAPTVSAADDQSSDPFDAGLTLQEAAYVYGYSKKTLRTLIEEGRLPAVQVETGRRKKLKWKVFPSGVPVDFFEAIASPKVAEPDAATFPAPPVEPLPVAIELPEIETELPDESITATEVEIETPGKDKKRKKKKNKKNKNKHKAAKSKEATEEALDFSVPSTEDSAVAEEEWTDEQEALFNALLARLYSDEQEVVVKGAASQSPVVELEASMAVERSSNLEPPIVNNLESTREVVLASVGESNEESLPAETVSKKNGTACDEFDENGLRSRLANLEDEVSQLIHKNANLENKVADLEAALKVLAGAANGKMRMQTMLFMIPFLLVICAAATAYLR